MVVLIEVLKFITVISVIQNEESFVLNPANANTNKQDAIFDAHALEKTMEFLLNIARQALTIILQRGSEDGIVLPHHLVGQYLLRPMAFAPGSLRGIDSTWHFSPNKKAKKQKRGRLIFHISRL